MQCLGKTYLGDFSLKGADLRKRGLNRIGNLLVPNDNYCHFEVLQQTAPPLPPSLSHHLMHVSSKPLDVADRERCEVDVLELHFDARQDWIVPILDEMLAEQQRDGVNWTPSKVIRRLGLEIKDESSLYHW
jgi:deoxyhypusine synthase